MPKTSASKLLGLPLNTNTVFRARDWRHLGFRPFKLSPAEDYYYGDLELPRYFQLNNPGDYTLQRSARVFFPDTNGVLHLVVLPPVTVPLHVLPDL